MQMSLDAAMGHTFSVAEFAGLVNELLDHTFPHDLWIQGEVRNLNRAASGHVYFTLVDPTDDAGRTADAQLRVVLFEQTKHQVNAQIKRTGTGMRIEDRVNFDFTDSAVTSLEPGAFALVVVAGCSDIGPPGPGASCARTGSTIGPSMMRTSRRS